MPDQSIVDVQHEPPHGRRKVIPKATISANLDMLRTIAVLCVFGSHLLYTLGFPEIVVLGECGVVMFFVHTSLVLMESLQRLDEVAEDDRLLVLTFWTRRAFRIYPLSILFVLIVTIFRIPLSPGFAYRWIGVKGFFANLALVQNLTGSQNVLAPLWTLPLEVQMYLILPFAYLFLRGDSRYRSFVLWFASICLAIFLPLLNWRLNIASYAPCFVAGVVAFDLLRQRKAGAKKIPAWLWPTGILFAILLFNPFASFGHHHHRSWAMSLGIALLYVNVEEATCGSFQKIFHWIAEHSYGIYLSHTVVIWFVFYPMERCALWARISVFVIGCVTIPALLYRYVEMPLILVGRDISWRFLYPQSPHEGRTMLVESAND
jgi:peptidoglycan/LPS O-acetylase OafA/YrhL